MSLFLSTYINKIDRKGRVSVPSAFRAALTSQPTGGVIVFKSYTLPALEAYHRDRMQALSDSLDQLDLFSENQEDLAAALFADAQQLTWDPEGRIMIPDSFLAFAHLEDSVAFVGRGPTFQLWNPQRFEKHQEEARARIRSKKITLKLPAKEGAPV
ncbi:MAG: cell division/cell wall cluster transcriptional repressor MraZ [Alphaproteobacteria bacterium RIFCSPLOWO2_01_FULL_45_8]|nr:MAG: cell division/cell wall cluster transcriptional repressor MraZ [Alphaproteobacteria bacterium GWB1_45_5]OFW76617.1 MAG: cell division/cell wall cluster transcriptional repressor MraZ [Alphaproteobacteria bacterium GWA1_45_9]OFW89701.1 MAG: cell division/cell wall cluster transcriptional repressor MraZ [Alphaproteobacteria bacterium RIFCSPHIGHO2_01_FULL_41_14]OFW96117.1 MAG: cell division/cell wall cluster transcriptional repressor MraZ [Alphaproteobacteria bacterium RIFCSPLOWO2_01_FULL_4